MAVLSHDELLASIAGYCQQQDDVLALLVVGSRAQPHRTPDSYSDLDLVLFTGRPGRYAANVDWLGSLADLWIAADFYTGAQDFEWQVLFQGGLKTDIVLAAAAAGETLAHKLQASAYQPVLDLGWTAAYTRESPLLDCDHARASQSGSGGPLARHLDVNRALVTVSRCLDFLQRGDIDRLDAHVRGPLRASISALGEPSGPKSEKHPFPEQAGYDDIEGLRQALMLLEEWAAGLEAVARLGFKKEGREAAVNWLQDRLADYRSRLPDLVG